ncbi:MAG: DUF5343 domain-containing protein [Alphaproteobacteria bacterium]|jgi:hypothetical protein|nr:DUF5343 domain-containing protein [Alphaproteobacteria bacterium]MBN9577404.1 DUF5343 domain-containing protein [Alphaproteobacteria bacterium]
MASLPYITSPGNIDKALDGIKSAAVPERVSQDFVKTILRIPGGSGDQMTSFLKKLGMTNSDGSPNDIYKKFRNPTTSGEAISSAIRFAYAPLYVRNEFMHKLPDAELLGLIVEETGQAHDANPVKLIFNCIKHLRNFANFEAKSGDANKAVAVQQERPEKLEAAAKLNHPSQSLGLNLGYTINLNLPATSDPEVFDAIFKSLKEHLLRGEDA